MLQSCLKNIAVRKINFLPGQKKNPKDIGNLNLKTEHFSIANLILLKKLIFNHVFVQVSNIFKKTRFFKKYHIFQTIT